MAGWVAPTIGRRAPARSSDGGIEYAFENTRPEYASGWHQRRAPNSTSPQVIDSKRRARSSAGQSTGFLNGPHTRKFTKHSENIEVSCGPTRPHRATLGHIGPLVGGTVEGTGGSIWLPPIALV